ncbi:hypothetical protein INR49_012578 [Caranx melampygus]|nr:hypothetical protein INR49_012578 [Caranx melampygus]
MHVCVCVYACMCIMCKSLGWPTLIGPVCVTLGCYLDDSGPCQLSSSHHLCQIDSRKRKSQHLPSAATQDTHTHTRVQLIGEPDTMTPLALAWTLLTVSLWTLGSSQIAVQDTVKELYFPIPNPATVECDCGQFACDTVLWFRSISSQNKLQYLGKHNNADRSNYGPDVSKSKFKFNKRGNTFVMRITNLKGCGALVLWPLVGLTAGLGLGLLCVLRYFSRSHRCPDKDEAQHLQLVCDSDGWIISSEPTSGGS